VAGEIGGEVGDMEDKVLTIDESIQIITNKYSGLVVNKNWGEIGLFYNPENKLKKGVYLLTFKEKDGSNDKSSNLNRNKDLYRLNLGISKETFIKLFGCIPSRPQAGKVIDMKYDFTLENTIMPHPVYGWMSWIGVINPTESTFKTILPLIDEGYKLCIKKYNKRLGK
jgi:hypothetical protein